MCVQIFGNPLPFILKPRRATLFSLLVDACVLYWIRLPTDLLVGYCLGVLKRLILEHTHTTIHANATCSHHCAHTQRILDFVSYPFPLTTPYPIPRLITSTLSLVCFSPYFSLISTGSGAGTLLLPITRLWKPWLPTMALLPIVPLTPIRR